MDEFSSALDVPGLLLLPDGLLIVWKWDHQFQHEDTEHPADYGENEDDLGTDCGSEVTHTLTFKCIGTTKESEYQDILRSISQSPLESSTSRTRL